MPVETASYISQLNPSNPLLSDTVYTTQQHLVLTKQVLQTQFPNLGAAPVTPTAAQLNTAAGAFSGSSVTVPQTSTNGAQVVLSAGSTGTTMTIGARPAGGTPGLAVVAQGPTVAGVTPPPVTEILSNGAGGVAALASLAAPIVSATTSIQKAGHELLPTGVICMWSGSIATIPGGWALCNGSNGTPNLQDKFIVGAGNTYAPGATGGSLTAALVLANIPSHSHTLTDPGHTHVIVDPGHTHAITDPGHAHGVTDPGHVHSATLPINGATSGPGAQAPSNANGSYSTNSSTTGVTVNSGSTGITGTQSHVTGVTNTGNTTGITMGSTGSGTAFGILPPYYALALIMKL